MEPITYNFKVEPKQQQGKTLHISVSARTRAEAEGKATMKLGLEHDIQPDTYYLLLNEEE